MPFMTAFFALRFPAGLGLYWIVTTLFSIGQQWVLSGPGGLTLIVEKFRKK
jgi:membrane protein insertase Oxa1/YidC/SpoIIIJ